MTFVAHRNRNPLPRSETGQRGSDSLNVEAPSTFVGCAGWSVSKEHAQHFPAAGSHLERYSRVFDAVEINSSFYRPHRRTTYERWAASVPPSFRFSVKVPKTITHDCRLAGCEELIDRFLEEATGLGNRLGVLLVQLPPSLRCDPEVASSFFQRLQERTATPIACEPRHPSWFMSEAEATLSAHQVCRVAADPAVVPPAAHPGGAPRLAYYRLHGSPQMYYSSYDDDWLADLAERMRSPDESEETWCIFDNTAANAAIANALKIRSMLFPPDVDST